MLRFLIGINNKKSIKSEFLEPICIKKSRFLKPLRLPYLYESFTLKNEFMLQTLQKSKGFLILVFYLNPNKCYYNSSLIMAIYWYMKELKLYIDICIKAIKNYKNFCVLLKIFGFIQNFPKYFLSPKFF